MKSIKYSLALLFILISSIYTEPIMVEQADFFIQPGKSLEIGIGGSYGYAKYFYAAAPTVEYENKNIVIPAFLRFKFNENIELSVRGNYRMLEETEFSVNKSGIGYAEAAGKLKIFDGCSFKLQGDIPAGNADISAVEGLNLGARLLLTVKLNPLLLHLNGGYTYTFAYTVNGMQVDPGNYIFGGASLEYEMGGINPLIEFIVSSVGKATLGGVESAAEPLLMDIVPGFSLQIDNIKIKAGLAYSLDSYNIYNWKVVSTVSILL